MPLMPLIPPTALMLGCCGDGGDICGSGML